MSDLPPVPQQLGQVVIGLRRHLIPETLNKCLEALEPHSPSDPKTIETVIEVVKQAKDDQAFEYWLHQRATVAQAVTVLRAYTLVMRTLANTKDMEVVAFLAREILTLPDFLTVMKLGLSRLADDLGPPSGR
jgi:hypothetical protein